MSSHGNNAQQIKMEPIINNLKLYSNNWYSKTHSHNTPLHTKHKYPRNILPRTESLRNKQIAEHDRSTHSCFQPKDTHLQEAFLPHHSSPSEQKDRATTSHSRTRKGIFSRESKLSRNVNSFSVKKSAQSLKINELFFCQKCYLYLFRIELDFHYPTCTNNLNTKQLSSTEMRLIGQDKLSKLEYTLKYTKTDRKEEDLEKILETVRQVRVGKYHSPGVICSEEGVLKLSDAEIALDLIFRRFFLRLGQ